MKIDLKFFGLETKYKILAVVIENDGKKLTLRDYCRLAGLKGNPQQAKHHLQKLLDSGMIMVYRGAYCLTPDFKKHLSK